MLLLSCVSGPVENAFVARVCFGKMHRLSLSKKECFFFAVSEYKPYFCINYIGTIFGRNRVRSFFSTYGSDCGEAVSCGS